jgi:hypothetical protein
MTVAVVDILRLKLENCESNIIKYQTFFHPSQFAICYFSAKVAQ